VIFSFIAHKTWIGTVKFALATLVALPILLSSIASSAQDGDRSTRSARRDRIFQIYRSRPVRVDGPLREENISDEEVREVEAVMSEYLPGSIVNIGGVTAGCPCEDGVSCDSQVWVVAHRANRSNGLMLSRIGGHWTIGPLQKWWRRYDQLRSQMSAALASMATDRFETYRKFQEQQNILRQEFPSCDPQA
jgi:hypothetical protein